MPTTSLNLRNIQGNCLGGFKKDFKPTYFSSSRAPPPAASGFKKLLLKLRNPAAPM